MENDKLVRLSDVIEATRKPRLTDAELRMRLSHIHAVDAVEMVRCRECRWCHAGFCELHDDIIPWGAAHTRWRDWFCADGQRREDGLYESLKRGLEEAIAYENGEIECRTETREDGDA